MLKWSPNVQQYIMFLLYQKFSNKKLRCLVYVLILKNSMTDTSTEKNDTGYLSIHKPRTNSYLIVK